jgi:hypothetical protein
MMESAAKENGYYLWSALLALVSIIVGAASGWVKGVHDLQSISDAYAQQGKFFCGTGIVFLPFFFALIGAGVGAVPGIAAAIFVYRKTARHRPRAKSDWAAYYGQ